MSTTLGRNLWTWSLCNDKNLSELQALIIDYKNRNVLVTYEGSMCVLPAYLGGPAEYDSSFNVEFVCQTVCMLVGAELDLFMLRHVWREEMEIEGEDQVIRTNEKAVVLLEYLHPTPLPTLDGAGAERFEWKPLNDVEIYHLIPDAYDAIRSEMRMAHQGVEPKRRLAWHRHGWIHSAASWIEGVISQKLNGVVVSMSNVLRATEHGIVIMVKTSTGSFYFKCTSPTANDAAYTLILSELVPKYVAQPVAVDLKRAWMLTSDFGDILEPHMLPKEERLQLTRDYVSMQIGTKDNIKDLIRAGIPDFRPETLKSELRRFLYSPSLLLLCISPGSSESLVYLQSNFEKLEGEIRKLQNSELPSTVTHNDLFFGNVYKTPGMTNYRFFDWVDAYVGHPFTTHMSGIHTKEFVSQWISYHKHCNSGTETFAELIRVGRRVRLAILLILTARDAARMEKPEADSSRAAFCRNLCSLTECLKRL